MPIAQLSLVSGLLASSYLALGNISHAYFGVMPLTTRGETNLPVAARLALWNRFFEISRVRWSVDKISV
jgi:hypothetical protein